MFYLIRQQKKLFLQTLMSYLDGVSSIPSEKMLSSTEIEEIAKVLETDNIKVSAKLLEMSKKGESSPEVEVRRFAREEAVKNNEGTEKIDKAFDAAKKTVIDKTKSELKTIEERDVTMKIDFGFGKTDFAGLRENINYSSYESIVKNMSYDELTAFMNTLYGVAKKNNSKNGRYHFNPLNIGELKDEFAKVKYTPDGFWEGVEMSSLFQLFGNVQKTQEKLNTTTNFKDKLGVIFDYNQDGLLDNNVHFYTKEKQFFDVIENEKEFENLLKNLGYADKAEFDSSLKSNYFSARSVFKERLGILLSVKNVLNPGKMLNNPNAIKEFNELKIAIEKNVADKVDSSPNTKNLPKETKDKIKLEAVGIIAGSAVGAGVSFDIKGLTNDMIDSLQIGIINGVPGVGISKNIFKTEKGRFSVDLGAVNLIPLVSASGVIKEAEYTEFKKLFPKEIDANTKVTLTAVASTVGYATIIDFSKVDEKTKAGIEKAKEKMSGVLDTVFSEIQADKTFEESSFKNESSNKMVYESLSGLYKSNGSKPEVIKFLKEGSLNNYENSLYQNADGLNFSGVGIGLIFLAGYFPIPLVLANGDYHTTEWKKVDTLGEADKNTGVTTASTLPSVTTRSAGIVAQTTEREHLKSNYEKTDSFEEINKVLLSFESAFSYKTRFNKGSYALMNPEHDLNTRWNGLLQLSRGVKSLRDAELNNFLKTVTNESDKWIVISTISQYMKKAKDFDNGDEKSWNTKTEKFINIDKKRRKAFDKMFGFSLQTETDEYYKKLQEGKGNISKALLRGVGFDATSSAGVEKNRFVKGIDTLYTNLSILTVDGKPLLIKITDPEKINAFKEKVKSLKNISEDVKSNLIAGIDNGTVELNFYKDPEGFDDRILPTIAGPITPRGVPPIPPTGIAEVVKNVDVFQAYTSTVKVAVVRVGKKEEITPPSSTQQPQPQNDGVNTTPGTGPGTSINDTNLVNNGGSGNVVNLTGNVNVNVSQTNPVVQGL